MTKIETLRVMNPFAANKKQRSKNSVVWSSIVFSVNLLTMAAALMFATQAIIKKMHFLDDKHYKLADCFGFTVGALLVISALVFVLTFAIAKCTGSVKSKSIHYDDVDHKKKSGPGDSRTHPDTWDYGYGRSIIRQERTKMIDSKTDIHLALGAAAYVANIAMSPMISAVQYIKYASGVTVPLGKLRACRASAHPESSIPTIIDATDLHLAFGRCNDYNHSQSTKSTTM